MVSRNDSYSVLNKCTRSWSGNREMVYSVPNQWYSLLNKVGAWYMVRKVMQNGRF